MSLILTKYNSIFYHIPKTGGTWIHKALKEAGIELEENYPKGNPHDTYQDTPINNRFSFAFVRHPLTWYQSYWAYRMEKGWESDWWLDANCKSDKYEQFILNLLDRKRPYLWRTYSKYVGHPKTVSFVGKQENLIEDLFYVLRLFNIDFDEQKIKNLPKLNITNKKVQCSEELQQKVLQLEKDVIKVFKYEPNI